MTLDVAIRNGLVVDGTGRPAFAADVGIEGGRIVTLGETSAAATEIDAAGLTVVPGFVDVHSHSDYTLLLDPRAVSALHQGVTTEVVGNCGHGCFPIGDPSLAQRAIYGYSPSLPLSWSSADGYFERLEEARPAVNVASLVPNGQLRLAVVGLEDRPATQAERAAMAALLEESLEQGAWGYSTGLEYAAERAAPPDELGQLCAVCARRDGLYATHTRYRDGGSDDAVLEAAETAEGAGVRLQVSHLVPRNGLAATRACVEHVERAAGRGLDVAFDMHTRLFGTTFLSAALPPSFLAGERLGGEEWKQGAVAAMSTYTSILSAGEDWSRVVLLDNEIWPEYARRDLASIAAEREQPVAAAICDLLSGAPEAVGRLMVVIHCYTEDQQAEAFAHPLCTPGSDATTLAPDGPLASSVFHGSYTWAAWFLRFMVRDRALLSLEEAVKRLSSDPAGRVGLQGRGTLSLGAHADVTVLDAERVRECGTIFEPNRLATGVRDVLVNGEPALAGGVLTGRRPGRVLRR